MKISNKAIDQPILVVLLSVLLFVMGIASFFMIPLESVPEIEVPYAIVSGEYRGAAPEEVEADFLKPLEEYISDLDNLEKVNATALQGMGFIFVQFTPEANMKESINELKEKVTDAEKEFIDEIENTKVREISFSDLPILILNLFGEYPPQVLTRIAEDIQDELEYIQGVNSVTIFGNREEEVQVQVDPDLLIANNLTMPQVVQMIRLNNKNMPGGSTTIDGQELMIRTVGEYETVDQLRNTILTVRPDGTIIRLEDIADVYDGYEDINTYSRYNGNNSVTLLISKKTGHNILSTTLDIEERVLQLAENFPRGLHYEYSARQSDEIEQSNRQLNQNAMWGALFVIITLFFGIGFRNSIIVTFAIPFSISVTFLLMYLTGLSQTGIAMFALIMVLGIVVDGAIIVSELTYRKIEEGLPREAAAREAINIVGMPILTSVLTTMAAFSPMMFLSGIMGQFLSVIPKVVIFSLIGAAIADHIIIPVLAARLMRISRNANMMSGDWFGVKLYAKLLHWTLHNRKLTIMMAFFAFTVGLVILGVSGMTDLKLVKVQAFPKVAKPRFIIDIATSPGSDLEYTNKITMKAEKIIMDMPEVERVVATVGQTGVQNLRLNQGSAIGSEVGQITVDLVDKDSRDRSVEDIIVLLNEVFSTWPGVDISTSMVKEGPPVQDNIIIDIQGDDLDDIRFVAQMVEEELEKVKGTRNVASSLGEMRTEIMVNVDHDRASLLGISATDISNTVASALVGFETTRMKRGLDDVAVIVKLKDTGSSTVDYLKMLNVITPLGQVVPLQNIADINVGMGQASITRKNFKRTVSVSADMAEGTDASDVKRRMRPFLDSLELPPGITVGFGGISDEASKTFISLGKSMVVAFFIILILLAAEFRSIRQPLIIAVTIPLSFVGVIVGLMITRVPFGMMAFFGIVALTGVVVNDAIVFISYVNDQRKKGYSILDALMLTGKHRLRPIMLTTITTIAGMIPLSLDFAGGAEYWQPLAVSIIFGLAFATILTLIIVPVLYSLFEKGREQKITAGS